MPSQGALATCVALGMRYADILGRHYTDYGARRKANPALRESPTTLVWRSGRLHWVEVV